MVLPKLSLPVVEVILAVCEGEDLKPNPSLKGGVAEMVKTFSPSQCMDQAVFSNSVQDQSRRLDRQNFDFCLY
ncbi:hypothetical protein llap_15791 [Limosa lapponica baueri]|uniref:Uncharacterized protein n=1 Tax=Limosa lapponica baueri TaxID=1758121 RepID=A0A2I0TJG3_LIMLA|nr:hypothetical protein llap_15791 [Limosa lapponica baueri]